MSAGVKSPEVPLFRIFLSLPISTLGWNAALARAEELAQSKDKPTTISFMDEATLAGFFLGLGRPDRFKHHLLLPSGGTLLRFLAKLVWPRHSVGPTFSPTSFLSALLTYCAEPRRVGFVGDDKRRLEALCSYFARHAPWHEFIAIGPDSNSPGRMDLVIVEGNSEKYFEHRLDGADIGLVVMAGRDLRRIACPQPVSVAGAKPSRSRPSLA